MSVGKVGIEPGRYIDYGGGGGRLLIFTLRSPPSRPSVRPPVDIRSSPFGL